jgi:hypothetical protein
MRRAKRTQYGIKAVRDKLIGLEDLVLSGSLLAIDPSCVSSSSNPGWALYIGGELDSSGEIDSIHPRQTLERRLQLLGKVIREEFDEPDVFAIEHIQMGGRINMQSTIRATGAIIGNIECENVISISPLAWQAFIQKRIHLNGKNDVMKYKEYKALHKSDKLDAEMIGLAIIELSKEKNT